MTKVILASKSPYRKQLLERLNFDFDCMNSDFDERPLKEKINDPYELTRQLSVAKARAIEKNYPTSIIIGSDQVCYFEGEILGKTGNYEKSLKQLAHMSGKEHELYTSYAIIFNGKQILHTNITKLKMKNLTELQLKKYLSTDNPIDCAGSYKLELKGISLMEEIDTVDETAIIGIPILSLSKDLSKLGITIPRDV